MKTYLRHTLTALLLLCCLPVHAQNITLDGTTGPHSGQIQPLTGPNYTIDATQGTTLGSNLYHGFQTFNLFQNESATFTGPADIRNVVNRVTGGPSSIDGLLQSTMPNANFYFLNPNGVFFGPQASVNVPNSFYVSTSANPQIGEASALVAAGPAGFQGMPLLTGERAERFGLLEVTGDDSSKFAGQPLGLEGDTVNIHDTRLSVASVDVIGKDSVNIKDAKVRSEGKVLLQGEKVVVDNSKIGNGYGGEVGKIRINADNELTLKNNTEVNVNNPGLSGRATIDITSQQGTVTLSGSSLTAKTVAATEGGLVGIHNASQVNLNSGSKIQTRADSGQAGDIEIKGDINQVNLTDNSLIDSSTFNQGQGGNVTIETNSLSVTNSNIVAATVGTGKGGDINVRTNAMTLSGPSNNAVIETGGQFDIGPRDSGNFVRDLPTIDISTAGDGSAGTLTIDAKAGGTPPTIELKEQAMISASTYGKGEGGKINIPQSNSVTLNQSAIFAMTMENSSGNGGTVDIYTGTLTLNDSYLSIRTLGAGNAGESLNIQATEGITITGQKKPEETGQWSAGITADTSTQGDATRRVTIVTPHLTMERAAISLSTSGSGKAGRLSIYDTQNVTLKDNSLITANTENSGDGGFIHFNLGGDLNVTDSSIAVGTTSLGKGGHLQVTAKNNVILEGQSKIPDSSQGLPLFAIAVDSRGSGNATRDETPVSIETTNLIVKNGATISVATTGDGKGGNLKIDADNISVTDSNIISATGVGQGTGGNIEISTTNMNLSSAGSLQISGRDEPFATIDLSTKGPAKAGNLTINAKGGTRPTITIDKRASISASTLAGTGEAGDLSITANEVNLNNNSLIAAASQSQGPGGNLKVEANRVSVTDSSLIAATGKGGGNAGNVEILTTDMNLSGSGANANPLLPPRGESYATLEVSTAGSGKAGDLTVGPKSGGPRPTLTLNNNASISASTLAGSSGNAGNLSITANQVSLDDSTIKSSTAGQGQGGNLTMTASHVSLNNDASFSAKAEPIATGDAGTISIQASEGVSAKEGSKIITESYQSQGGNINITASDLSVTNSSEVNANVKDNAAQEANININVNSLTLNDNSQLTSSTSGNSQSGTINIHAQNAVSIADNGEIASETTGGSGDAGQINVTTPQLSLANHGKISTTSAAEASGHSGSITLNNVNHLVMGDQSAITAQSQGSGNAGSIRVNSPGQKAELVSLNNASNITTEAQYGAGGSIEVNAKHLSVENNSNITANVEEGNSGALPAKIQLNVNQLRLQQGNIKSSTNGQGPAGNIAITATEYLDLNPGNILSEASGTGRAGEITIGPVPRLTLAGESAISTTAKGPSDSGSITIDAYTVQLPSGTSILSKNLQGHVGGKPANIKMTVSNLELAGGEITTSTEGSSQGGNISITASDYIQVAGGTILSTADASGDAGQINIKSPKMTVTAGKISTKASGSSNSGQINLDVATLDATKGTIESTNSSQNVTNPQAANIKVNGESVNLKEESQITSSTSGTNPAGQVTVIAKKDVTISTNSKVTSESMEGASQTAKAGEVIIGDPNNRVQTLTLDGGNQSIISTTAKGASESGAITLYVNNLTVKGGAAIKSESEKGYPTATPADIKLEVKTLTLGEENKPGSTGKISTTTMGASKAGDITITASEYVEIFGGGGIASDSVSVATGPAGTITITARGQTERPDALTVNGGKISTNTSGSGKAGDITVLVENNKTLKIDGQGKVDDKGKPSSGVFSASLGKPDDQAIAGTITIGNTNQPVSTIDLSNKGQISTASYTKGDSGDVKVYVDTLTLFGGSSISAESNGTSEQVGDSAESNGTSKQADYKAGKAGKVTIQKADQKADNQFATKKVEVSDSKITTQTQQGEGGEISIQAEEVTVKEKGSINAKVKDNATTPAGITINSNNLTLNGGGRIESSTEGNGNAGVISITASDYIAVSGVKMAVTEEQSGIFSTTSGNGNAGTITLGKDKPVPTITLSNEGQISTATISQGQGGTMDIKADQLTVNSGGVITAKVRDVASQEDKSTANIDVTVTNQLSLQGGGRIESSTTGTRGAGTITVTANQMEVSGQFLEKDKKPVNAGIFSTSGEEENVTGVTGDAGTITIGKSEQRVSTINLSDNGQISTQSFQQGKGGEINLYANDLTVTNGNVNAKVNNGEDPKDTEEKPISTANISVNLTNQLSLQGGGRIESSTTGTRGAGTITVTANQMEVSGQFLEKDKKPVNAGIFSTSGEEENVTGVTGDAGTITIGKSEQRVSTINLSDNGQISTQSFQQGKGGEINLYANDLTVTNGNVNAKVNNGEDPKDTEEKPISTANISVNLTNQLSLPEGGRIESSTTGTRGAGTITVTANQVEIAGANIESSATAQGNAGRITISATQYLALTAGTISTSATGQGDGGNIRLESPHLKLSGQRVPEKEVNKATISATKTGGSPEGKVPQAGNIDIQVDKLDMSDTLISTEATGAEGGNISIDVKDIPNKRITDSTISATVTKGQGKGGNVTITSQPKPKRLYLDNTDVIAKADEGKGGKLSIKPEVFIASADSEISASSEKGIDGEVQTGMTVDVSALTLFPNVPADASKLIKDCTAAGVGEGWSLVPVGSKTKKTETGQLPSVQEGLRLSLYDARGRQTGGCLK